MVTCQDVADMASVIAPKKAGSELSSCVDADAADAGLFGEALCPVVPFFVALVAGRTSRWAFLAPLMWTITATPQHEHCCGLDFPPFNG